MKRIASLLIIIFLIGISVISFADNEILKNEKKIEVKIGGQASIKKDDKIINLTIDIGNFNGLDEEKTMGYEVTLDYDKNIIDNVVAKGLNNWSADYSKTTNRIIGEVSKAKSNTSILQLTFTLKNDLITQDNLKISFKELTITDDEELDMTVNLEKEIKIISEEKETNEDKNKNVQDIQDNKDDRNKQDKVNQQMSETSNANKQNNENDNTIVKTRTLPKTGINRFLVPIICILIIIASVSIIKSNNIKIK